MAGEQRKGKEKVLLSLLTRHRRLIFKQSVISREPILERNERRSELRLKRIVRRNDVKGLRRYRSRPFLLVPSQSSIGHAG